MIVLNDCGTRVIWMPAWAMSDLTIATSSWKAWMPVA